MSRIITALCLGTLLAGCDGTNPFMVVTAPDGTIEAIDPNDPNVDVNNKFAFDPAANITMNSVEYDAANDQIVINNIPFDGPDGRYDDVAGAEITNANGMTSDIYQNRENVISGEMQYYAMFVRSDYMDATSVGGANWGGFGFAGANVNRDSFAVPGVNQSSYVYAGMYAATRTYDERGGIELIRGDATLLLDVADLDPNFPGDGLQGTIVGNVTNRTRDPNGNQMVGTLPDISLVSVSFNTETGVWEEGVVRTFYDGDQRDTGIHEGLIAGPNGEEMGGYLVMQGVADIQRITYDVVTWQVVDAFGNTVQGTTSGQQLVDAEFLQAQVNAGIPVGNLGVTTGDLPIGAVIVSTTTDSFDLSTEYDAREIGVFIGDLDPPVIP